jgi:hypothetical protein
MLCTKLLCEVFVWHTYMQGAIGIAINGVQIFADTDADGGDAYVSGKTY